MTCRHFVWCWCTPCSWRITYDGTNQCLLRNHYGYIPFLEPLPISYRLHGTLKACLCLCLSRGHTPAVSTRTLPSCTPAQRTHSLLGLRSHTHSWSFIRLCWHPALSPTAGGDLLVHPALGVHRRASSVDMWQVASLPSILLCPGGSPHYCRAALINTDPPS